MRRTRLNYTIWIKRKFRFNNPVQTEKNEIFQRDSRKLTWSSLRNGTRIVESEPNFIFFQFFRIIGQECKKKNRKVEQVLSLTLIPFNPSHRYQSFLPLNPGRQTATQAAKHVANIIVPPSEPLMFAKFHRRLSPARLGDSPFIPIRIERGTVYRGLDSI